MVSPMAATVVGSTANVLWAFCSVTKSVGASSRFFKEMIDSVWS
jgi:hypothetical protein